MYNNIEGELNLRVGEKRGETGLAEDRFQGRSLLLVLSRLQDLLLQY